MDRVTPCGPKRTSHHEATPNLRRRTEPVRSRLDGISIPANGAFRHDPLGVLSTLAVGHCCGRQQQRPTIGKRKGRVGCRKPCGWLSRESGSGSRPECNGHCLAGTRRLRPHQFMHLSWVADGRSGSDQMLLSVTMSSSHSGVEKRCAQNSFKARTSVRIRFP